MLLSARSSIRAAGPALLAGLLIASRALALTPDHRLERTVVPTSESLRLDLDAGKPGYGGSARIALKITAATDSFQFHALDLELGKVALRGPRGPVTLRLRRGPHGVVTARAASRLAAGAYTFDLAFTNPFDTRGDGLYRLEAGGEHYIASQFEAVAARRAFPCWDEPEFKIPWTLTVTVPRAHLAISNTPVARDTVVGETRTITFERTPPLPSYLIAILAGPWETVPVPGMSVPGRIVTVRGATGLAGLAAAETPKILAALERYFGQPYPFKKLDLIAVPQFWAGAMENAGAVTFRDRVLLLDPREAGARERRDLIAFAAHELAHMWFGDFVTMRWWDDLWLNESFASWMGDKVTQEVAPEYEMPLAEVEETQRAMLRDAQRSTRPIRAPIDGFDNIDEAFDELAYQKGQAVLGMIEQWLTPETFQRGIRGYLAAHAWGNAAGADLWNALSQASGRDVSPVASSYLGQAGLPILTVTVREGPALELAQYRFYNLGATPPAESKWLTPVTFKYSDGAAVHTRTVMVSDTPRVVVLEDARRVAWVLPNADERGYYHWAVDRDTRWTLVDRATELMSPRERMGFVNNLAAGLDAGLVSSDETLQMLARIAADPQPQVVEAVLGALDRVRMRLIVPDLEDAFALYVRKNLTPALERVGPAPIAGEPRSVTLLRPRLLWWLGRYGRDAGVLARARALADSCLADPAAVDPSLVETALGLAAGDGDAARFEAYRQRFEQARTPLVRNRFLGALGAFRDSTLVERALDYTLTDAVRPNDMRAVWLNVFQEPRNQEHAFRWMTRHYDAVAGRMPDYERAFLVRVAGGCSPERLEAARSFFIAERRPPGYELEEAKVADQVTDCATLRLHEGNTIRFYLTSLSAAK